MSESTKPRRWLLRRNGPCEPVEVMPVSEHEAALAAARQVDDAMVERARKAINEMPAWQIQHAAEGKPEAEEAIARAALLAALKVEDREAA